MEIYKILFIIGFSHFVIILCIIYAIHAYIYNKYLLKVNKIYPEITSTKDTIIEIKENTDDTADTADTADNNK